MEILVTLLTILAAAQGIRALEVPQNVRDFYERVKVGRCEGSDKLKGGYSDRSGQNEKAPIFLHGPNTFADTDIDCDGDLSDPGDGRCGSSEDTQGQTVFVDQVRKLSKNKIKDLNANIHPYVVFGNDREDGGPTFNPQKYGVKPLSVMAVVCGEKLIYGIWADTNGDDGPPVVGEASISLATACYGTEAINGNSGHDESDVLYVAFTGEDALPGPRTKWDAKDFKEFEDSIEEVGNRLIERLK
ncbi:MAG: hypothetical protein LQ337_001294 [Flavoplaca oasis]|nr:MAG: hypothetical protein LQ337_001294 [Flavoplaca oasis]